MAITVSLNCRLGNNLFQLAAGIAHSHRTGQEFIFPDWEYNSVFGFKGKRVKLENNYYESRFDYVPIPDHIKDCVLHGYFQSEKYFEDFREKIRSIFFCNRYGYNLKTCAIHIRLKDYLTNRCFVKLGKEYYSSATKLVGDVQYSVYSDDIPAAMVLMQEWGLTQKYDIRYSNQTHPVLDLWSMASHSNVIMANSTFSWWGAWLSGGRTIAPKLWFTEHYQADIKDLIPDRWERI